MRKKGRGGSANRGRGRGRGRPVGMQRRGPGGGLVNVGVIVTYHQGDRNMGRFKWPSNISEEEGLRLVLTQLGSTIDDVCEISFNQVPGGNARIPWIESLPQSTFRINQEYAPDEDEFEPIDEEDLAPEPEDPDFY